MRRQLCPNIGSNSLIVIWFHNKDLEKKLKTYRKQKNDKSITIASAGPVQGGCQPSFLRSQDAGPHPSLDFHYKDTKLLQLEHKTPEFKKINPMGTVPVLQDGDFIVSESHAIMQYLTLQYGGERGAQLYPRTARERAQVDQCMYFNAAVIFNTVKSIAMPTLLYGIKSATEKHLQSIEECYDVTEAYLHRPYMAADHLTLADLSLSTTIAATQILYELDSKRFPRTADWLSRMSQEDFYREITEPGIALLKKLLYKRWGKNK